jgi:hypothetical protein
MLYARGLPRESETLVSFKRGFLPRPVRRAMHPVRSTAGSLKRQATPRAVRTIEYARHPVGTATTRAGRSLRRALFK